MSLIIARATDKSILLVSDTKLSYKLKKANPFLEGTAKVLLIDESRLVSFAGIVEYAQIGINQISICDSDDEIIRKLSDVTSNSSEVEFIFATITPKPRLVKITRNEIIENQAAWIGDYDGFKKYQEYFMSPSDSEPIYSELFRMKILQMPDGENSCDAEIYSKMFDCMSAVIDSGTTDSVGGFTVPVFTYKGKLQFAPYCSIFRRPLDMSELEATNGVVPFGDVSMGTFTVKFTSMDSKNFAVHLEQGQVGIVFTGNIKILEPKLCLNIDEIDFLLLLKQDFSDIPLITVSHNPVNYFIKSEAYLKSKRFLEAETFLTEGIQISSKNWKSNTEDAEIKASSITQYLEKFDPPVNIPSEDVSSLAIALQMRGTCRWFLGNFNGALQDFRESIALNPNDQNTIVWQAHVEQFISHNIPNL
jgi:tetratricopeptide (TPR) repeat protein